MNRFTAAPWFSFPLWVYQNLIGIITRHLIYVTDGVDRTLSSEAVKLRTWWWVLTSGARSEMSEDPLYAMRTL